MKRPGFLERVEKAFRVNPVVALLGPRQCGKTTLAQMFSKRWRISGKGKDSYFDLEDPTHLARLENPKLALQDLRGLIVIDEIQRAPELFPVLRVLVDRKKGTSQFLILGSASRELIQQSSESLAGRISFIELTPFDASEVGAHNLKKLWLRGGFPPSFLARNSDESMEWKKSYIATFLERDIPNLGLQIPSASLRRFWLMLTHYHGQTFNASETGRSLGVADTTARRYLDILAGTFMIRELPSWWENVGKRQVKSPKIYFRDSGILHAFLGLQTEQDLMTCPKLGASWEGFALEETIRWLKAVEGEIYFWATHNQAELDLFVLKDGNRRGFEFKYTDSPKVTKSMEIALRDLKLKEIKVVFPGKERFPLHPKIEAIGLATLVGTRSHSEHGR